MPYTTLVAGTTITASWANASVRDQTVTPHASAAARTSAVSAPVTGMLTYRTDGNRFEGYDGAGYVHVPYVVTAYKTSNETVNNSAVLQADDALLWAVAANGVYMLDLKVLYNSGTTPDIKFGFTYPVGLTAQWGTLAYTTTTGATEQNGNNSESGVAGNGGVAADVWSHIYGLFTNGGTAGTLTLTWAQNTANGSDTIVKAGSHGRLMRVA